MSTRRPSAVYATAYPSQTEQAPLIPRARPWRQTPSVNTLRVPATRDYGGQAGAAFSLPSFRSAPSDQAASAPGQAGLAPATNPDDCNCG